MSYGPESQHNVDSIKRICRDYTESIGSNIRTVLYTHAVLIPNSDPGTVDMLCAHRQSVHQI